MLTYAGNEETAEVVCGPGVIPSMRNSMPNRTHQAASSVTMALPAKCRNTARLSMRAICFSFQSSL